MTLNLHLDANILKRQHVHQSAPLPINTLTHKANFNSKIITTHMRHHYVRRLLLILPGHQKLGRYQQTLQLQIRMIKFPYCQPRVLLTLKMCYICCRQSVCCCSKSRGGLFKLLLRVEHEHVLRCFMIALLITKLEGSILEVSYIKASFELQVSNKCVFYIIYEISNTNISVIQNYI